MKYLIMMKGQADVLATLDDKQGIILEGAISIQMAENILLNGSAKAKENLFFVPTEDGSLPLSIKKAEVLTLDEYRKVKPAPGSDKPKPRITDAIKARVFELRAKGHSKRKTGNLCGISPMSVIRIENATL